MRTRLFILVLAALTLALLAPPTMAQQTIEVDDSVTASTQRENVIYSIELNEGASIEVTLSSQDFDSYLEIIDAEGKTLIENDDSTPDFLDASVAFTAPRTETYRIIVRSWIGQADGEYTLTVNAIRDADCGDICVGQTITESITGAQRYQTKLEADQRVTINLSSEDFDTVLQLYDNNGLLLAENDDIAEGDFNSQIVYTSVREATYTLVVQAFSGVPQGDITLQIEAVSSTKLIAGEIPYDEALTITPDEDTAVSFTFEGTAGDTINLIITSQGEDDSVLILYGPDGIYLVENDDGGSDFNPALRRYTLPQTGTYEAEIVPFNDVPFSAPFEIFLERTERLILEESISLEFTSSKTQEAVEFFFEEGKIYRFVVDAGGMPIPFTQVDIYSVADDAFLLYASGEEVQDFSFRYEPVITEAVRLEVSAFPFVARTITITAIEEDAP